MPQHRNMILLDYFDRIAIIHLRERTDRYRALINELWRLGIDISDKKVSIPEAPKPLEANGFPSRGVYGNFLSHLEILKSARDGDIHKILVLEDDAIFSRRFAREQHNIVQFLSDSQWDICFFGHNLTEQLKSLEIGFPRYSGAFECAHCYAVHSRILPRLIDYLEETIEAPIGHPRGAKMYIDGAYNLFRKFNPDVITLVANPLLCIQRGSPSSLANGHWYDRQPVIRPAIKVARAMRDECWRWTGWSVRLPISRIFSRLTHTGPR
jgi:glycosyl transferase, family 25